MQGDNRVDKLMIPVKRAIDRHVKDSDAKTEIYNRAYEALMDVMDTLDASAQTTANQIAKSAADLQRADTAEKENALLRNALERFSKIDPYSTIGDALSWDILNARAVLKGYEK